jgi:hypothetical protein
VIVDRDGGLCLQLTAFADCSSLMSNPSPALDGEQRLVSQSHDSHFAPSAARPRPVPSGSRVPPPAEDSSVPPETVASHHRYRPRATLGERQDAE